MWTNYKKTFSFRDCFEVDQVHDNVAHINNIIKDGVTVFHNALSIYKLIDKIEVYKEPDSETLNISFMESNDEIACVSLWDLKEVQLCFEIEENLESGKLLIHHCEIIAFTEYQK